MNKTLKTVLIILACLILAIVIFRAVMTFAVYGTVFNNVFKMMDMAASFGH